MKQQQHLLIVCNYDLKRDRIGGMDRFFRAYNDQLTALGHKVSWFFSGGELIDFYSGFDIYFPKGESLENAVLRFLDTRDRVDVLVTHFLELCTPFYRTAKRKGVKSIIAVDHNPRPLQGFPPKKRIRNRLKGWMYSWYIDSFVGVSEYTRRQILRDYGKFLSSKSIVIYNGIDTGLYTKRQEGNKGKFIVASHLRESKGIRDLILAVHQLPEKLKNGIHIDIYGEGPLENKLKEQVSRLGLHKQFSFLGSSPKLPLLLYQYSFLLQPTYMECFSLSILESLSANVPVVTTPVGGNPEIIKNSKNGFLFPAGDIGRLSEILEQILKGELKIAQDVSRNIERNYNLQKMVSGHLAVLPL